MKTKIISSLLLLLLAGCRTPGDTPNLRPVPGHPGLWRGGQPTQQGWILLSRLGITNVVKLNPGHDKLPPGMAGVEFPIDCLHQTLLQPSQTLLSNAVAALGPGTYVHCTHGEDRTGLVIGCLRVWQDGWTKTPAYGEMLSNGFHPSLRGLVEGWERVSE